MEGIDIKRLKAALIGIGAAACVICIIVLFFFKNSLFSGAAKTAVLIAEPFIYGFVIAYLLVPVCEFLERLLARIFKPKVKGTQKFHAGIRLAAILLSIAFLLLLIIFLVMAVLPEVVTSLSSLISQIPPAIARFRQWLEGLDTSEMSHELVTIIENAVNTISDKVSGFLKGDLLPYLQSLVTSVTTGFLGVLDVVKNFGLGCIISAYLLMGREKFLAQAKLVVYALFPRRLADWIREEVHYTDRMFSGFIHGKLLDSLIIGLLCFAFTLITRMPYAVLVSIVVGVTNIIPFFGPYLGAIPSAIIILTVSPVKCLIFVVFIILLQQVDGNIIGPRILGDRMGLSGFWILFSILIFGSLWGFVGMVIGVPVFAVIYDIIRDLTFIGLRKRNQNDMACEYRKAYAGPSGSARTQGENEEKTETE